MTLILISIGLADERDLSLRALEDAKICDRLYAELYTMRLATTLAALSQLTNKPVTLLPRGDLEEHSDRIIEEARGLCVGVLIGGDCLSATTHISLLIDAAKKGVKTRVVHGSSVFSAVAETGLSLYKFGRTVTIPLPEKAPIDTVAQGITENQQMGLHTLILLDLDTEAGQYITVKTALEALFEAKVINPDTLVIGAARIGHKNQIIKAGRAVDVVDYQFGEPPQLLVLPGSLHFVEEDALRTLHGCPPEVLKDRVVKSELDDLIEKYITGCRRVKGDMKLSTLPSQVSENEVRELLEHVDRYVSDAEYYRGVNKQTALTSVAYAEGVLDALKLLGLVEFEW